MLAKKNNATLNQSVASGMDYCLFKRECDDDKILEEFLASHMLEYNDYNLAVIKDFAENSIESPIDFKNVIKKLQKRARIQKKEEIKFLKRMNSMSENSTHAHSQAVSKER